MGRIVGAFGVSHGPLLTTPPDQWHQRAAVDKRNTRHAYRGAYYDYPSLLTARNGGFGDQLDLRTKTERYERCQAGVAEVARRFAACGANCAVIFGNDQRELFRDDFTPAFLVYAGAQIENVYPDEDELEELDEKGLKIALHGHAKPGGAVYPGAPEVAGALVDALIARDFDVAISSKLPRPDGREFGIPHAYGFIFRRIMNDAPPPTVPLFSNVGETRNQPRLGRMLALGRAVKAAIDALPDELNVALFSSGGLSHFTIDEEFDRDVIAAMRAGDEAKLASFPESWFWGNTCETKSWYPMIAAMNDASRRMDVIDYVPCYRSEAGTGQAMIFASWS